MKSFLRSAAYKLTTKRINEKALDVSRIELCSKKLNYFSLSTNPIISFSHDGKLWYFRECPPICDFNDYYLSAIDRFFKSLSMLGISEMHFKQSMPIRLNFSEKEIQDFKTYINEKIKRKSFIKALSRSDKVAARLGFSIWENQKYGAVFFASFGLSELKSELWDIAVYFLWCMRSAAMAYKKQKIARGKRHSFFGAVRSVASRIVAEEMGLEHLITDARFCTLALDDGENLFGVLSPSADGCRMLDIKVKANEDLKKELWNLALLDAICNQPDHGANNVNVAEKDGSYTICAFDNDNPKTFFPSLSPFAIPEGFDAQTVKKLQSLDVKRLKKRLSPYLNFLQLFALESRIKKIKKQIKQ